MINAFTKHNLDLFSDFHSRISADLNFYNSLQIKCKISCRFSKNDNNCSDLN